MMDLNKSLKVLIIDWDATSRNQVKNSLQLIGIRDIECTANAVEAKALLDDETKTYDLIVSEAFRDETDSLEFLKSVKSDPRLKSVSFVMVTSENKRDSVIEAISLGVDNYLIKPFKVEEIESRIGKLFGNKILRFIEELKKFATGADIEVNNSRVRDDDRDEKTLELFAVKMNEIKTSALYIRKPHIFTIAALSQELALKARASSKKKMRKVMGCLWDSISTISFMFADSNSEGSEENDIIRKKLEKMIKYFAGSKLELSDGDIESLLFEKMCQKIMDENKWG